MRSSRGAVVMYWVVVRWREVAAELLDEEFAAADDVRVEGDAYDARLVDGDRRAVAAAVREDVLHGLAVEAAEDVDEAGAVLDEVRRAVGVDRRADHAADIVRVGLRGPCPAGPVVGRRQARDARAVRVVELDRAVRQLDELRLAGNRVAGHDGVRRTPGARDRDRVGQRRLERDELRPCLRDEHRRDDGVVDAGRERVPRRRSRSGGRSHDKRPRECENRKGDAAHNSTIAPRSEIVNPPVEPSVRRRRSPRSGPAVRGARVRALPSRPRPLSERRDGRRRGSSSSRSGDRG